jgi:hypothetical protein
MRDKAGLCLSTRIERARTRVEDSEMQRWGRMNDKLGHARMMAAAWDKGTTTRM